MHMKTECWNDEQNEGRKKRIQLISTHFTYIEKWIQHKFNLKNSAQLFTGIFLK